MIDAERVRLLSQLQRQLRERLAPRLQSLFDELDSRLFDLAERSRVGTQQHAFFDGLRECRRKRADIEHDFLGAVVAVFRPPTTEVSPLRAAPLSLVALDELEESLTLSALADRTAARLAVPLDALDRRLAALLNAPREPSAPPRLAPQAMGTVFRIACQRLDVGIEVRLVAYALFGNHVLAGLDAIYAELNRELVGAGVLAGLESVPPRPVGASTARAPAAPAARSAPARTPARAAPPPPREGAIEESESLQALLRDVRQLIAPAQAEQASAPAAPIASNETAPRLSPRMVLDALDRLHAYRDEPRQLKQELLAASRRLGAVADAALPSQDEDMVDLVGLVFDFVRHDHNLPEPMQPLIARLQVPFLKVALSDPELLHAVEHPARKLVDELGDLAVGWTPASDPEGQLLARIGQVVDSLLQPHDAGRAPFERAIADLRSHIEVGRHRAELAEQRAVEAALGRERLRIARSRVAAMLERRLARFTPLPWIRQLLRGPWANYLVLLWLRQGETGESYREGLAFVDELLWCDEHGAGSIDDARLRVDEAEMDEDLRHGLSTVAYHDREIERLASELRQFIGSLRRRTPAPSFMYESDPKLGTSDFSVSWNEHALEDQPGADQVDSALLARLRAIAPGTWFELGGRGHGERAKLSWTSPFTGRCLFVNRNGLRVDEVAPERLAEEIERGLTRIIEGTRLLQRALQTLMAQLLTRTAAAQQTA